MDKFEPGDVVIAKQKMTLINGEGEEVAIPAGTKGEIECTGFNTDVYMKSSYTVHFGDDPIVAVFDGEEMDEMIEQGPQATDSTESA